MLGVRRCQKQHWAARGGNHRAHCNPVPPKPAEAAAAAAPGLAVKRAAAVAAGAAEPAHPCPICLENEDDHGKHGQCTECGRLYCGDCNVSEVMAGSQTARPAALLQPSQPQSTSSGSCAWWRDRPATPAAQCNLGMMYEHGTGVPQDHADPARWFRLAADQGHASGLFNLGVMCADGTEVPQDHAEATRWYRLAADQRGTPAGSTTSR